MERTLMRAPAPSKRLTRFSRGFSQPFTPTATGPAFRRVTVTLASGASQRSLDPAWLKRMLLRIAGHLGLARMKLAILIVDDRRMRRLNRVHLGRDSTTDVLAFDLSRQKSFPLLGKPINGSAQTLDGEIYMSLSVARRSAADLDHPLSHELLLYATHGLLHLIGFDDHEPQERRRMHDLEDRLLIGVGVGPVFARRRRARP